MEKDLEEVFKLSNNNIENTSNNLKNLRLELQKKQKQEYILSVLYLAESLEDFIVRSIKDEQLLKIFALNIYVTQSDDYNPIKYFSITMFDADNDYVDQDILENIESIINNQFYNVSFEEYIKKDLEFELTDENLHKKTFKDILIKNFLSESDYISYQKWKLNNKLEEKEIKSKKGLKI